MPYGIMSSETTIHLRAVGLEDAWNVENPVSIDVVCNGALDESFDIQAGYERQVVDALADLLKVNSDLDDWEVVAYIPEIETLYTRRSK